MKQQHEKIPLKISLTDQRRAANPSSSKNREDKEEKHLPVLRFDSQSGNSGRHNSSLPWTDLVDAVLHKSTKKMTNSDYQNFLSGFNNTNEKRTTKSSKKLSASKTSLKETKKNTKTELEGSNWVKRLEKWKSIIEIPPSIDDDVSSDNSGKAFMIELRNKERKTQKMMFPLKALIADSVRSRVRKSSEINRHKTRRLTGQNLSQIRFLSYFSVREMASIESGGGKPVSEPFDPLRIKRRQIRSLRSKSFHRADHWIKSVSTYRSYENEVAKKVSIAPDAITGDNNPGLNYRLEKNVFKMKRGKTVNQSPLFHKKNNQLRLESLENKTSHRSKTFAEDQKKTRRPSTFQNKASLYAGKRSNETSHHNSIKTTRRLSRRGGESQSEGEEEEKEKIYVVEDMTWKDFRRLTLDIVLKQKEIKKKRLIRRRSCDSAMFGGKHSKQLDALHPLNTPHQLLMDDYVKAEFKKSGKNPFTVDYKMPWYLNIYGRKTRFDALKMLTQILALKKQKALPMPEEEDECKVSFGDDEGGNEKWTRVKRSLKSFKNQSLVDMDKFREIILQALEEKLNSGEKSPAFYKKFTIKSDAADHFLTKFKKAAYVALQLIIHKQDIHNRYQARNSIKKFYQKGSTSRAIKRLKQKKMVTRINNKLDLAKNCFLKVIRKNTNKILSLKSISDESISKLRDLLQRNENQKQVRAMITFHERKQLRNHPKDKKGNGGGQKKGLKSRFKKIAPLIRLGLNSISSNNKNSKSVASSISKTKGAFSKINLPRSSSVKQMVNPSLLDLHLVEKEESKPEVEPTSESELMKRRQSKFSIKKHMQIFKSGSLANKVTSQGPIGYKIFLKNKKVESSNYSSFNKRSTNYTMLQLSRRKRKNGSNPFKLFTPKRGSRQDQMTKSYGKAWFKPKAKVRRRVTTTATRTIGQRSKRGPMMMSDLLVSRNEELTHTKKRKPILPLRNDRRVKSQQQKRQNKGFLLPYDYEY